MVTTAILMKKASVMSTSTVDAPALQLQITESDWSDRGALLSNVSWYVPVSMASIKGIRQFGKQR